MRNLIKSFALPLMAMACIVLLGSCSGKKDSAELLETYASSKDKVVATINLKQLVEQSGSTIDDKGKLELSSEINAILKEVPSGVRSYIDYVIENEYLEYENAIVTFDIQDEDNAQLLFAFNVKDSEKFIEQVGKDLGDKAKEKDGWWTIDLTEDIYLMTKDDTGMILCTPHGETPVRFMEKLQKRAEDHPLAEDVAKRLTEGDKLINVFAHYEFDDNKIPSEISNLINSNKIGAFFTFNMEGKTWKTSLELTTYDGKSAKGLFNGTVNPDLLEYAGKGHTAAILVGNVKEYLQFGASFLSYSEKAQANQIAAILDGPAMISGSVNIDEKMLKLKNDYEAAERVSLSAAVTCANGRSGELIDMLAKLWGIDQGAPDQITYAPGQSIKFAMDIPIYDRSAEYEYYSDSVAESTPERYAHLSLDIHTEGNLVVAYFNSTPGSNKLTSKTGDIKDSNIAIITDSMYSDLLAEMFGMKFGLEGTATLKGNTISATTTATNTDKTLLQCYLSLVSDAVNKVKEERSKYDY